MEYILPGKAEAARSRWPGLLAAGILVLLLGLPALLWPDEFVRDDSYFYLQIAQNIAAGHGSTFHGITPTNGYHPLWMAAAVGVSYLAGGDRGLTLHLVVVLQILLSLLAALLFHRLARLLQFAAPWAGVAILLVYLLGLGIYASEAHLNAVMLLAAMVVLWHAMHERGQMLWVAVGAAFGLAVLARLDNLFVAGTLCGLAVLHGAGSAPRRSLRRAAAGLLGGLIVLAPYLVHNELSYGHLNPISGAIKSTFPDFSFQYGRLGPVGVLAAPFGLIAAGVGLWLDREPRRRIIWLGLGAGVVVHGLYVVGFTDHYTFWPWYYVSGVLAAAMVASWLPGWLTRVSGAWLPQARVALLAGAATLLILAGGAGRAWLKVLAPFEWGPLSVSTAINDFRWTDELGRWMKANLPPGSRVFTLDWPGAVAWYSELPILPMDGLVNDFRYNDELLEMGVSAYLCTHGIGYYLGWYEPDGPVEEVAVEAPLYRRPAGVIRLRNEDLVIRVRDIVSEPDRALPFAIWRFECPPDGLAETAMSRDEDT